ncbi:hypothetical protein THAOC_14481, partial [Thalassiosira oceanica]
MTVPGGQSLPPGFGGLMNSPPSDPLLLGLSCVAALSLLYLLLVFRPRTKGGSTAPPVVTSSPVSKLPVIGDNRGVRDESGEACAEVLRRLWPGVHRT